MTDITLTPEKILKVLKAKEIEAQADLAADEASPVGSTYDSGYLEGRYEAYSVVASWLAEIIANPPRV